MNTHPTNRNTVSLPVALGRVFVSMNFAIMLLVVIAIASVIGTILQQNLPYQDYIIKFGPYWHEIYRTLGLYDVYSSGWFVTILAFLVLTTGTCVYRNGPKMLQNLQRFNEGIHERTLLRMPEYQQWVSGKNSVELKQLVEQYFAYKGYRTRTRENNSHVTIAAKKGGANRVGYILTHVAIVVICIGGLLDGNLPLKVKQAIGQIKIETRDLSVSDIPADSRLPADNSSFRASVSIPEKATVNYAFINMGGGYLLQHLPFSIKVNDFRIEHYDTGQPKSFASDIVIHDPENKETFESTISVNHPLLYRGYAIYQSSFGDGGTRLQLQLHNLLGPAETHELQGTVNNHAEVTSSEGNLRIEFDDFRLFNIFSAEEGNRNFVDYGPNFTYKLRREDGTAHEYINYMYPVPVKDGYYFLSGVRGTPAEEFHYLYIPVDADNSPDRFFRFQSLLFDEQRVEKIIDQSIEESMRSMPQLDVDFQQNVKKAMMNVLEQFRHGGIDAISSYSREKFNEIDEHAGMQAYLQLLYSGLQELYLTLLESEGINSQTLDDSHGVFFDDAIAALNAMHYYDSPFYLRLQEFEHRQATGLQVTRTPGKKFVYTGFAMLITGIFFLFYIHYQRVWARLESFNGNTRVILAGTRNRYRRDFSRVFSELGTEMKSITTELPEKDNVR